MLFRSSCTNGLLDDVKNYLDDEHRARLEQITLLDAIAWCDSLLPSLTITRRIHNAAVHPTCSTTHMGLTKTFERLAARLADEVIVPVGTTCCGTAGDRMGLRQATGRPYESFVFLLEELTR